MDLLRKKGIRLTKKNKIGCGEEKNLKQDVEVAQIIFEKDERFKAISFLCLIKLNKRHGRL
jgi:hypothetical protein